MENGGNIKNWGAHGGGASSVKFTHDGKLASTGRDKVTKLWDQNGAAQKSFEAFPDLGLQVAVTHENAKVIAGDWSGVVKTWAVADAKLVATLDANPKPIAERLKDAEAALRQRNCGHCTGTSRRSMRRTRKRSRRPMPIHCRGRES